MAYLIDGEIFKQVAERKFLAAQTLNRFERVADEMPCVQMRAEHTASKDFEIIQFEADFYRDIHIRNVRDVEHVSIHFQLNGSSKAKFDGIKPEHPLFSGDYNMYYSKDYNSKIDFNKQAGFIYLAITLKPEFLLEILTRYENPVKNIENLMSSGTPFALSEMAMPVTFELRQALHSLIKCSVADNLTNLYVSAKVAEIVALQLSQFQNSKTAKRLSFINERKLEDVCAYVNANFLLNLSMQELARDFSIPENLIKQGLRERFNASLYEILQYKRMQYARQELLRLDRNVNEIAWEIGYANASNFIVAFKKKFGITPKKYDRLIR